MMRAKVLESLCMTLGLAAMLLGAGTVQAVDIQTVPVGNPGNVGELSGRGAVGGYGPDCICGAVEYEYNIGKYQVTAGQYTEFLNAVAATDSYGLYSSDMWLSNHGCKIQRSGSSGSYTYSVAADWANRPVNYVSWGDAARFANWLHNDQPTGAQDLTTTEDGAYYLNGATSNAALLAVSREADWKWAITSEDEWYKAAYHKNDGVTGNYWDYPTSTNSVPSNDLITTDPGNNANFYQGGYTIGSPYWRTEVGEFENSDSPYDTFDQGGNVQEWNEAILYGSYRGLRGGSFCYLAGDLHASYRYHHNPTNEDNIIGFRVCEVPEPASMTILALGAVGMLRRRRSVRG
jgi:formylglycine-generating enzyme required for sulfatase activity